MSYLVRGPASAGIDGKANGICRRHHERFDQTTTGTEAA